MVWGKTNRGRHTDHPAGCHSIRTNQCPPPPSAIFYRLDALPATQPIVSKHRRQIIDEIRGRKQKLTYSIYPRVSLRWWCSFLTLRVANARLSVLLDANNSLHSQLVFTHWLIPKGRVAASCKMDFQHQYPRIKTTLALKYQKATQEALSESIQ